MRAVRREKKKESQGEIVAPLRVWSEDLQACSGRTTSAVEVRNLQVKTCTTADIKPVKRRFLYHIMTPFGPLLCVAAGWRVHGAILSELLRLYTQSQLETG
ncbi:hypothetical protein EYF80_025265 [Liparis tanakae]|uniref:Uncharacterized protein n=1 Tax=Liparis tanakae TaxID=230148 RepID=A0A4Z2HF67_9TELE|nr:hypothetical protein EYF80_025265 [Liparis tanakae]